MLKQISLLKARVISCGFPIADKKKMMVFLSGLKAKHFSSEQSRWVNKQL